ncbi:MAG: hypothetical protein NDJ75_00120 [Thermoanaerobaculia bacterium]|nr:hypothetical protein [Thermoanaerobaculia bacterium]
MHPANAATVDGSVRLGWTETDLAGSDFASTDHAANLSLEQELTPYLRLRLYGGYGKQTASLDGDETFSRSSLQPLAELRYGAPNLSWRVAWENLRVDSSSAVQEFESNALNASLSWRARGGFRLGLGFRESTNETENVVALGRGLDQRVARADLSLERRHWSVGYGASHNELRGGASDVSIEQLRQDVRLSASRAFRADTLRLSFAGTVGRLDAEERRGDGDLGEPVAAIQGLFAIDASPSVGELQPAPGLIDGDLVAPTSPAIEIGGGNTLRNLGLDFGLPLPATRLDIVVDRASGAQVVWEVYESADGLIWEPVPVVQRLWDPDLLRYRLRFPETSERYLKAVNVTTNPATDVRVTELRALRDLSTGAGTPERSSDLYRVAASLAWRIAPRLRVAAGADASNDTTTVGGVVRRDTTGSGFRAGLDYDVSPMLAIGVVYRHGRSEEGQRDGLTRTYDDLGGRLRWTPLPAVDAALTAGLRRNSDDDGELSNLEYVRAMLNLDLLDELRLISDLGVSRLDSVGIGAARDTLNFSQRVEMIPRRHWRVGGGYTWVRSESAQDGAPLFDSTTLYVDVTWIPGSALTVSGGVWYSEASTDTTIQESLNLNWSPGPKLTVSLGWGQYEQENGLLTGNDSLSVYYQAASRLVFFGSLTRSRSRLDGATEDDFTSLNAGATLTF